MTQTIEPLLHQSDQIEPTSNGDKIISFYPGDIHILQGKSKKHQ